MAATNSVIQTKSKIQQLDKKINTLKQNLASAHDIHQVLDKELEATEKRMSTSISKLRLLQRDITNKQQAVIKLKKQENELNTQLQKLYWALK